MASKCTIQFDNNPFGIYYAGQVVTGTAELITTRPKTIRCKYSLFIPLLTSLPLTINKIYFYFILI